MVEESKHPTAHKRAALGILRTFGVSLVVVAVMSMVYAYLPDASYLHPSYIAAQVLFSLAVYITLIVVLFIKIKTQDQLNSLGILLLAVLITFFILSFSWLYRQIEAADPGAFSEPLSDISAVYFTIAVLSTVGFGDIRPLTDLTRGIVTAQMILGVGLLTATIGLVTQATRHVTRTPQSPNERKAAQDDRAPGEPGEMPPTPE